MAAQIDGGLGLIYAEALSFALTDRMSRPDAQATVKVLSREALESGTPLRALAERDFPGDWARVFEIAHQLGTAPSEARAFARSVRKT